MVYLPILLSTGICPDNLDAFVRQQYRWCSGNVGIVFSWRLWKIRMSVPARLAYISGFFYYAYTALVTFFGPVIPIVMLAFLPGHVRLRNFVVLLPAMFTGLVLYPLWHRSRFGLGTWPHAALSSRATAAPSDINTTTRAVSNVRIVLGFMRHLPAPKARTCCPGPDRLTLTIP